jgi:anti-anti-sigma factor
LTLTGDLDYAGAPTLRDAVTSVLRQDRLPARLVVDLTGVRVVDSIGLGTLVVGNRICGEVGVDMAVRSPERVLGPIVGGPPPDPAAPVTI